MTVLESAQKLKEQWEQENIKITLLQAVKLVIMFRKMYEVIQKREIKKEDKK